MHSTYMSCILSNLAKLRKFDFFLKNELKPLTPYIWGKGVILSTFCTCSIFPTDLSLGDRKKPISRTHSSCFFEKIIFPYHKKDKKINKHFEEFSEAAQVEIYRSASLQLNIVKLRLRFHFSKYSCHFQMLYI